MAPLSFNPPPCLPPTPPPHVASAINRRPQRRTSTPAHAAASTAHQGPGCTRKRPTHAAQATTCDGDDGTTTGRRKRAWGERRKVSTAPHHAPLTAPPPDLVEHLPGAAGAHPITLSCHVITLRQPCGPDCTRPLAACAVKRPNARQPHAAASSPKRTRIDPESATLPPCMHVPPLRAYPRLALPALFTAHCPTHVHPPAPPRRPRRVASSPGCTRVVPETAGAPRLALSPPPRLAHAHAPSRRLRRCCIITRVHLLRPGNDRHAATCLCRRTISQMCTGAMSPLVFFLFLD